LLIWLIVIFRKQLHQEQLGNYTKHERKQQECCTAEYQNQDLIESELYCHVSWNKKKTF